MDGRTRLIALPSPLTWSVSVVHIAPTKVRELELQFSSVHVIWTRPNTRHQIDLRTVINMTCWHFFLICLPNVVTILFNVNYKPCLLQFDRNTNMQTNRQADS